MKAYRGLLITVLLPSAFVVAQVPARVPATAPTATDAMIQAVRTAPDLSATIDAYTRAIAAGPAGTIEFEQAFVRRMLELGAPELVEAQANDLVNRGAADALIRGAAAFNDALRGNAHAAINNLNRALSERPNDPFLLSTAGQVVAWFDAQANRSTLLKEDVSGVASLRLVGKGRPAFDDAYRGATQAWQSQTAASPTGTVSSTASPAAAPTTQHSSSDSNSAAPSSGTSYNYYYPSSSSNYGYGYSHPYYSYGSYYYPYGYASGYSRGYGASYSASARFGDSYQDRQVQRAAGAGVVAGAAGNWRSMLPLAVNPAEARAAQGNAAGAGSMLRPPPPGTGQPPQAPAAGAQAPPPQAGAAPSALARSQPSRPPGPPPAPPRLPGPPPGPPHP